MVKMVAYFIVCNALNSVKWSGGALEFPQQRVGWSLSRNRIWYILALNVAFGGNNFDYFLEKQLTAFSAS